MKNKVKKLIALIFLINLAVIFYFWLKYSGHLLSLPNGSRAVSLGRITGLLSVYSVLIDIILISRVIWLEKYIGFDKLARWHHYFGIASFALILTHFIFITIGYAAWGSTNFLSQTYNFLFKWEEMTGAYLGLILFFIVVITSITFSKLKVRYEWWYLVHLSVYAAILVAFSHQLENGGDFAGESVVFGFSWFALYWYFLYFAAFVLLLIFRFLRPLWYFWRHRFAIEKIVQENSDTWSIYITGRQLKKFHFAAGQFAWWRFLNKNHWWSAHPFSFSDCYNGEYLRLTVKKLGDFSGAVKELPVGAKVIIDGPHGAFTIKKSAKQKLLFVAGGIGLTPLLAIAKETNGAKDIIILNCNRHDKNIIFENEFKKPELKNIKLINIISQDTDSSHETGRLDKEKIQRLVPDFLDRAVLLCGPITMMTGVASTLKQMGITEKNISFENFSFN